jgi:hypothetical protein
MHKLNLAENLASQENELGDVSSEPVALDASEVVRVAMTFNMDDVVARYATDYNLPIEVAREHGRELKRYLAIAALFPQRAYGMIGPVDKIWHTFILSTGKYSQFCQSIAGRYIHHFPDRFFEGNPDVENTSSKDTLDWYECFLGDYKRVFGEEAPRHIWPRPMDYTEIRAQVLCRVCGTDPRRSKSPSKH